MRTRWGDKRYNSLNYFLREKFGQKVFKVSLDAGFSCPNRDGKVGVGGCVFCSERGSGDFTGHSRNLVEQFEEGKAMMSKKWKNGKYIAYFQAYTNTYAPIEVLRERYFSMLDMEDVVGIAIATRPDCLGDDVIELIHELSQRTYVWVELGLQSIHEDTVKLLNIGYKLDVYIDAVRRLKEKNIEVVTHAIIGLPGETRRDMLETINFIANTGTQGIKLHLLHLMKNTALEKIYQEGKLKFLTLDEYVDIITEAIELLPQDMVVHRITGDAPRELLIGPMWSLKKWEVVNAINHNFELLDVWQGKKYKRDDSIAEMFE